MTIVLCSRSVTANNLFAVALRLHTELPQRRLCVWSDSCYRTIATWTQLRGLLLRRLRSSYGPPEPVRRSSQLKAINDCYDVPFQLWSPGLLRRLRSSYGPPDCYDDYVPAMVPRTATTAYLFHGRTATTFQKIPTRRDFLERSSRQTMEQVYCRCGQQRRSSAIATCSMVCRGTSCYSGASSLLYSNYVPKTLCYTSIAPRIERDGRSSCS